MIKPGRRRTNFSTVRITRFGRKEGYVPSRFTLATLIYTQIQTCICTRTIGPSGCTARERPYLIKQRVLTRQPHTFPSSEMPLSIQYEHFHVTPARLLTLSAFTSPSVLSLYPPALCFHLRTFFQSGLKTNRGLAIVHGLQNLLHLNFCRRRSR